ncbi:putative Phosphoesterase PA-phosphatase-like protein [uncultured delta proteobacterium]|uniref:Putative Phosphoesterase PA-phosphatase-like protein n=1 Tax=uncultured delta proteobacterium TaxID=34034 RepID=A0A212JEL9_9DELT|nr:putative Phosphoesterase PA-phosphatase-like protein [uncultured delta proteobacterium]
MVSLRTPPPFPVYALFSLAALLCVIGESVPALDRCVQDYFFRNGEWLLTERFHAAHKTLLYTAPKVLVGLIGGAFLLLFFIALTRSATVKHLDAWKKPALLVGLSIALVPLTVAGIKAATGVYGPVDLLPYGGKHPHIGLLQQLWHYGHTAGGRSFPAGHASGGFALISLYYLPVSRLVKRALLTLGLCAGWLMGLYQTARGEHFISHTLATMCITLAVVTFLARKLRL